MNDNIIIYVTYKHLLETYPGVISEAVGEYRKSHKKNIDFNFVKFRFECSKKYNSIQLIKKYNKVEKFLKNIHKHYNFYINAYNNISLSSSLHGAYKCLFTCGPIDKFPEEILEELKCRFNEERLKILI